MAGHWQTLARRRGYDPKKLVDVPRSFGRIVLTIAKEDQKGARFGDGEDCSGARCIRRALDAEWAWVGVSSGIIKPKNSQRLLRFQVNGIANKQDKMMNVVGDELILRSPGRTERLGASKARKRVGVRSHKRAAPGEGAPRKFKRTTAALWRNDPTD